MTRPSATSRRERFPLLALMHDAVCAAARSHGLPEWVMELDEMPENECVAMDDAIRIFLLQASPSEIAPSAVQHLIHQVEAGDSFDRSVMLKALRSITVSATPRKSTDIAFCPACEKEWSK